MILAKIVDVTRTNAAGPRVDHHRNAVTVDVTPTGVLVLYGDQNSKTSKIPVVAFPAGKWDQVEVVDEP